MNGLAEVLTKGDIRFACLALGCAMIAWGIIGYLFNPADIAWFAKDFFLKSELFWFLNCTLVGVGYLYVASRNLPEIPSLMLGVYSSCMWSLIAVSRPAASYTSGITMNFVVILMGAVLIHRSRK
jgi:hypothetical protein